MTRCCVPFCNGPGGHRFPKDKAIRKLWLKAIRRINLVPNEGTRLCRHHFTDNDYIRTSLYTGTKHQHNYLKKCAVPSIFPWTKSNRGKQGAGTRSSAAKSSAAEEVTTNLEEKERTTIICCVLQCNSKNTTEGVTFHPFPKNKSLRKQWSEILNVDIGKSLKVCSLHFDQSHFFSQDGSPGNRLLKGNALPTQMVTEVLLPKVEQPKIETSFHNSETMSETAEPSAESPESAEEGPVSVCRACLKSCGRGNAVCDIYQAWSPPWFGMEPTIAEDLAKIANIEVSLSVSHIKTICHPCYQSLLDAATFVAKVRYSDTILKQRCSSNITDTNDWPKPIQIDKNIDSSVYERSMDVDIKKEVLSDEEYGNESAAYMESAVGFEIKVEPEDIEEPPPLQIEINGTMSLNPNTNNPVINGIVKHGEQHLEVVVKQEPLSAEEDDEAVPDLPLECMLCAKSFQKVSGLKAHVIAEHSYKTVKRKSGSRLSPEKEPKHPHKYICQICKRSFTTTTDLMVHETCHNMFSCYSCYTMFDSFEALSKHRMLRCKALRNSNVKRLKTLDDVMRYYSRAQLETSKNNSPTLDTGPVPEIDPIPHANPDTNLSEISPVSDTKPVYKTNAVSDVNSASDNNLVSASSPISNTNPDTNVLMEINQVSETNSVSDIKPFFDTNPALDINQVSKTNPVLGIPLVSDTKPVLDIHSISGNDPMTHTNLLTVTNLVSNIDPVLDINPVSDVNVVSETNSVPDMHLESEMNAVPDTNTASETNPVSDTNSVKVVSLNNIIDKIDDDTSNSSMKLHLEIHSAKREAETMDVSSVQDNVEMQVETLRDDDSSI